MRIPEIQDRLRAMAKEYYDRAKECNDLADELSRRPAVRRAPPRSRRCTAEMKDELREYAQQHPTLTYQQIAEHFHVNAGRVSEACAGFRT